MHVLDADCKRHVGIIFRDDEEKDTESGISLESARCSRLCTVQSPISDESESDGCRMESSAAKYNVNKQT